jgi:hypothetical protein
LSGKRGTEDLDFFIGDEAIAASGGPGRRSLSSRFSNLTDKLRIWHSLSHSTWSNRELGMLAEVSNTSCN